MCLLSLLIDFEWELEENQPSLQEKFSEEMTNIRLITELSPGAVLLGRYARHKLKEFQDKEAAEYLAHVRFVSVKSGSLNQLQKNNHAVLGMKFPQCHQSNFTYSTYDPFSGKSIILTAISEHATPQVKYTTSYLQ